MQQVLIFVIIIGIGAFYLFSQVQPEIASWFDRDLKIATSTTKITPKSSSPSLKTAPARNASRSDAGGPINNSGKIKISNLRTQTRSSASLITLTADETIDITGWEFKTKTGSFLIPNIIARQGDTIYISSDPNPFLETNKNFRPDKCLGYLSSSRTFTIPLPQTTCPRPQTPSYVGYWCQQYINTLANCQSPTSEGMAKYELFKDDNCVFYLNSNFNYNGCVANYQNDPDFLAKQWHIYLDSRNREIFPWDNELDTLYLRDKNGLLVDKKEFGQRVCCD